MVLRLSKEGPHLHLWTDGSSPDLPARNARELIGELCGTPAWALSSWQGGEGSSEFWGPGGHWPHLGNDGGEIPVKRSL